jgi:curli biogenesis system outer membrane secretion channel CsgG
MNPVRARHHLQHLLLLTGTCLALSLPTANVMASDPVVDRSNTSNKLQGLKRQQGQRKVVTIYQFRSGVPEVSAQNATDMFTTALIKSGQFAVAERQRLNEGVIREKQLNAQGKTTGSIASQQLAGADYIFEGSVTEANRNKSQSGIGATFQGLGVNTNSAQGEIGLDVRVIDANNGVVLDAINVRKAIKQGNTSVSGIGSFLQKRTGNNLQGADLSVSGGSKDGVDAAVRECIEEAIFQIVKNYGS